jgi:drug/metabolite transporter (DMT)-like permease
MPRQQATIGWVLLALTAASIEPVLVKLGFQLQATPLQLLVLKNMVGAAVMFLIMRGWTAGWSKLKHARSGEMLIVSLLLTGTNALTMVALTRLSAVELITIITTTPLMVALVNLMRRRDNHGRFFWPGLTAAIAGVILSLQLNSVSFNFFGAAFALAAVLSSTVYRVRIENILGRIDAPVVSLNIFVINGVVSLALLPFIGVLQQATQITPYILWMGAAGAIANLAFIAAVKELGATRMSVINLVQRPLVLLIAAVTLKEMLSWQQILGFALVLAGVQLAQVKPRRTAALAAITDEKMEVKMPSLTGK